MSFSAPPVDDHCSRIDRTVRRALVQELPEPLRRLYRSVLVTTMRQGLPVDPDALAVVLSVIDECAEEPSLVTCELVQQLLWYEIAAFCARSHIEVPIDCTEALFALVAIGVADETVPLRVKDPEKTFGVLNQLGFTTCQKPR